MQLKIRIAKKTNPILKNKTRSMSRQQLTHSWPTEGILGLVVGKPTNDYFNVVLLDNLDTFYKETWSKGLQPAGNGYQDSYAIRYGICIEPKHLTHNFDGEGNKLNKGRDECYKLNQGFKYDHNETIENNRNKARAAAKPTRKLISLTFSVPRYTKGGNDIRINGCDDLLSGRRRLKNDETAPEPSSHSVSTSTLVALVLIPCALFLTLLLCYYLFVKRQKQQTEPPTHAEDLC